MNKTTAAAPFVDMALQEWTDPDDAKAQVRQMIEDAVDELRSDDADAIAEHVHDRIGADNDLCAQYLIASLQHDVEVELTIRAVNRAMRKASQRDRVKLDDADVQGRLTAKFRPAAVACRRHPRGRSARKKPPRRQTTLPQV